MFTTAHVALQHFSCMWSEGRSPIKKCLKLYYCLVIVNRLDLYPHSWPILTFCAGLCMHGEHLNAALYSSMPFIQLLILGCFVVYCTLSSYTVLLLDEKKILQYIITYKLSCFVYKGRKVGVVES